MLHHNTLQFQLPALFLLPPLAGRATRAGLCRWCPLLHPCSQLALQSLLGSVRETSPGGSKHTDVWNRSAEKSGGPAGGNSRCRVEKEAPNTPPTCHFLLRRQPGAARPSGAHAFGGLEEGVLLSPGERWWPWTSAWWGNPGQVIEDTHGRVEYVQCQLLARHLRSSPPEFGEIGCTLPVQLIRTLRLRQAGCCPVLSTPGLSAQLEQNKPPRRSQCSDPNCLSLTKPSSLGHSQDDVPP